MHNYAVKVVLFLKSFNFDDFEDFSAVMQMKCSNSDFYGNRYKECSVMDSIV